MGIITLYVVCVACYGTGIRHYISFPGGEPMEENPCSVCSGTGKMPGQFSLDSDLLDNIFDKINKVKDKCDNIKDKCDQIWDKVK